MSTPVRHRGELLWSQSVSTQSAVWGTAETLHTGFCYGSKAAYPPGQAFVTQHPRAQSLLSIILTWSTLARFSPAIKNERLCLCPTSCSPWIPLSLVPDWAFLCLESFGRPERNPLSTGSSGWRIWSLQDTQAHTMLVALEMCTSDILQHSEHTIKGSQTWSCSLFVSGSRLHLQQPWALGMEWGGVGWANRLCLCAQESRTDASDGFTQGISLTNSFVYSQQGAHFSHINSRKLQINSCVTQGVLPSYKVL